MCVTGPGTGGSTAPRPSNGGRSELNRVLRALANERCRHICYHVVENDPTDVSACVEAVASVEMGRPPAEVPDEVRQQIETMLYHQHLPKLTELGIVDYDDRSGAVRCAQTTDVFERFLELAREIEIE